MGKVTGLEGIIAAETSISLVDGENGLLVYRGHTAKNIALTYSFEECAYLLLHGVLPANDELAVFKQQLLSKMDITKETKAVIDVLPTNMDMMSVLRTTISSMGDSTFSWPPTIEQAIKIVASIPTIIAYRIHRLNGSKFLSPNKELGFIANYLYMLNGAIPSDTHVRALSAYFTLTAEHGLNASTFSARTILSTQSDIISAITGAIGAMKGSLHGGAPSEVIDMLNEIGSIENTEKWLRMKLDNGERIMGFGHRIYKTEDPRAAALKVISKDLSGQDPWLDLALYVEETATDLLNEYKPGRRLYTNVEFYAAAVLRAVNIPPEIYTATFTASRVFGWAAHILEQSEHNRIFRPQSTYVGGMPS